MKLEDYFLQWFETYRKKYIREVSAEKYLIQHRYISNHDVGKMKITMIKRKHAQMIVADFGESRSKQTVQTFLSYLKACFNDAVIDGLVKLNPFQRVDLVYKEQKYSVEQKKKVREKKFSLEVDEYERLKSFLVRWLHDRLRNEPTFSWHGERVDSKKRVAKQVHAMMIYVALKSGARFSEIMGLTREDIDFETMTINIDKTWDYKKTNNMFIPTKNEGSVRKIILDQEAMDVFRKYVEWLDEFEIATVKNTLFIEVGKRTYNSSINLDLRTFIKTVGIADISFHKLRHTHASYLIANKISLQVIAKRLGHTDTNMIQRVYGHLLIETEMNENKRILELI